MSSIKDTGVERAGDHLDGKRITLCVTGGIAAIETPKLARHLRRHGALVRGVMSKDAEEFITPRCLAWGCGEPVVTGLSGGAEHITDDDLIIVAPTTLNTISKMALGIADTPVTALLASALGAKTPIILCPTMHQSMWANPLLQEHLARLRELGVLVIPPRLEEGKAKLPRNHGIVDHAIRALSSGALRGKRFLITAGPTRGWIDDVRFVSNISSGALGARLAHELWLAGADVTIIWGPGSADPPQHAYVVEVETPAEMLAATITALEARKHDAAIFTAAVLDFAPAERASGKLPTSDYSVKLTPTPKIIREVHARFPDIFIVGFKLESGIAEEALIEKARHEREKQGSTLIVANRLEDIGGGRHRAIMLDATGVVRRVGDKRELTMALAQELKDRLGGG